MIDLYSQLSLRVEKVVTFVNILVCENSRDLRGKIELRPRNEGLLLKKERYRYIFF